MKISGTTFILYKLILVLLILTGCTPVHITADQISQTSSATVLPSVNPSTVSPEELATFQAFPTSPPPISTANSVEEMQIVELLQSKDCILPCYFGIVPGKTSLKEAKHILENLGSFYKGDFNMGDGIIEYPFTILKLGYEFPSNETPASKDAQVYVAQNISLISNNDVVQIVEVGVSAKGVLEKYRHYWKRYSAEGIFLQLGVPDQIYINSMDPLTSEYTYGRTLFIVYSQKGVVIELYGAAQENNICPKDQADSIRLRLSLYNPISDLNIYSTGRVPPTNREVYLPIEEVSNINTSEFYNQVLANPSTCFVAK